MRRYAPADVDLNRQNNAADRACGPAWAMYFDLICARWLCPECCPAIRRVATTREVWSSFWKGYGHGQNGNHQGQAQDQEGVDAGREAAGGNARRRAGFAIGSVHLRQQPVVAGWQVENAHVRSARLPSPHEALEQPRAIGVEFHHPLMLIVAGPGRGLRVTGPRRAAPIAWRVPPSKHCWPSVARVHRTACCSIAGRGPRPILDSWRKKRRRNLTRLRRTAFDFDQRILRPPGEGSARSRMRR